MAEPHAHIEELVQAVTAEVLARLEPSVALPAAPVVTRRPERLWSILPGPSGRPALPASLAASAAEVGLEPVLLVPPGQPWAEALHRGPRVLDGPGLERALAEQGPGDILVLLGLGFELARRLLALEDDDPVVRLAARGLLAGAPVLAASDDLDPAPRARGRAVERARELTRELGALGLELVPAAELSERVRRLRAAAGSLAAELGGLVTEAEVEALAARGERRVRLGRGCLVTPLAASRAAELGLELARLEE
jgi:hypothetical protein